MKKAKRVIFLLIIASLTIILVVGCSSTKKLGIIKTSATTKYSQTIKYDATAIKSLYLKTLKAMVKAGTITQEQSDKVIRAVIKDLPKKADGTSDENASNNVVEDVEADAGRTNNAHDNHILSALIINRVLSQAQANTINQKLGETVKSTQSTNTR